MATVWTIGHSSLAFEELLARLVAHGIEIVADVRRVPASRRHPHFGRVALAGSLERAGLGYRWIERLGGKRTPCEPSMHVALDEPAFAGYADHMATPAFIAAVEELVGLACSRRVAVMCAEQDPAGCHRRILADWLLAHGHEVRHVRAVDRVEPHVLSEQARRLDDGTLVYDRGRTPRLFGA